MYIGLYKIAIVRIFNYLMDQNACSSYLLDGGGRRSISCKSTFLERSILHLL